MSDSPYIVDVSAETFMADVIEKSQQVPVLVDFWAEWCGPCKSLMPILAKLADEFAGAFMLAKVDTDAEQMIATQMGIRSLPTVVLFQNGQPVDQFMGVLPESGVREFLAKHINAAPQDPAVGVMEQISTAIAQGHHDSAEQALNQLLENDKDDVTALLMLGELKLAQGDTDGAKSLLGSINDNDKKKPEYKVLSAKITFSTLAAEHNSENKSVEELNEAVQKDEKDHTSRFTLAIQLVMQGELEQAMLHLLEIVKRDRAFNDDGARKTLVQIFDLLGSGDRMTAKYRGLLAKTLN